MALGITIVPLQAPAGSLFKGRRLRAVRFAGDGAKPTGGYTVTAANVNLRIIHGVLMGVQENNNLMWAASVDTTASSTATSNQMTLQAYTALGSGGNATASETAVSIAVVTCLVYGV